MDLCQYVSPYQGWECTETRLPGSDPQCIFHSPDLLKPVGPLLQRIKERQQEEQDFLRFDGSIFPEGIGFQGDQFPKGVCFYGAVFHSSKMQFDGANFGGNSTSFERALFLGKEALFVMATFGSKHTNFRFSEFRGSVNFGLAEFYSEETDFTRVRFSREALFRGLTSERIFPQGVVDFSWVSCDEKGKVVFDRADLSKAKFLDADLLGVEFIDVAWAKEGWRFRVYDEEVWFKKHCDPKRKGQADALDLPKLAHLYRTLKRYYKEVGDQRLVGHFNYGLMEAEWNQRELDVERESEFRSKFKKWLSWEALYRTFSGYGEDYALAGRWVLWFFILFSVIYWKLGIPAVSNNSQWTRQGMHSLLYSLQIGSLSRVNFYLNQSPCLLARYLQLVESVLIPVQFGFFCLCSPK